ncbi:MAG: hypothetical protein JXB08_02240 [Bacilli bacterium]|nr:hypothetical protein [Bacilli bacterium]MBN2876182.1 hypothetical protein [Bacilli bacterium]
MTENPTFTKKQYITTIVLMVSFLLLGFGFIGLVTIYQDQDPKPFWFYLFLILAFVFWIGDIIYMFLNLKKLMQYEFERKFEKNKNLEKQKLSTAKLELSEETIDMLFASYKRKKLNDTLYWIFRPNYLSYHISYILSFEHNLDMVTSQTEEENEEEEEEFSEEELKAINKQIPNKANTGVFARVAINVVDSLAQEQLVAAQEIVTNQEIASRTFGRFAPIYLYYIYDKSTSILYYEPYKRYKMYPRPKALKLFNKMLGIEEQ